jgi:hypothetical protein
MLPALLLAAACTPLPTCTAVLTSNCATPTPTITWDHVNDTRLAGYKVYAEETGGPLTLIATLPCEFRPVFVDDDDVADGTFRFCPGADLGLPVTRFVDQRKSYNFTVKAYVSENLESVMPSLPVTICMPPLCVPPGQCS